MLCCDLRSPVLALCRVAFLLARQGMCVVCFLRCTLLYVRREGCVRDLFSERRDGVDLI